MILTYLLTYLLLFLAKVDLDWYEGQEKKLVFHCYKSQEKIVCYLHEGMPLTSNGSSVNRIHAPLTYVGRRSRESGSDRLRE